jgi:hypothetical protein
VQGCGGTVDHMRFIGGAAGAFMDHSPTHWMGGLGLQIGHMGCVSVHPFLVAAKLVLRLYWLLQSQVSHAILAFHS